MRAQLTELHEAGVEPVAVLTASEPVIYGRFGYGLASDHQQVTVPKASRALRPVAGVENVRHPVRRPGGDTAQTTRSTTTRRSTRPGMFQHDETFEYYVTHENVTTNLTGASPLRCVLAELDGELVGYTHFRTRRTDKGFVDVVRVHVRRPGGRTPRSGSSCSTRTCSSETKYALLPSDDPLLMLLVDPRAANATTLDGLWGRVTDVGRALAARTYAEDLDVVLGVEDDFLPWNAGSWHLAGGPGGATCEKTDRSPDLVLGVRELGTAYLGRPSLGLLGAAGLVEERTAGALAVASRAFLSPRVPWLDTGF